MASYLQREVSIRGDALVKPGETSSLRSLKQRRHSQTNKVFGPRALKVLVETRVLNAFHSQPKEDISGSPELLETRRDEILAAVGKKLEYVYLSADETCRELGVNPTQGLTTEEAEKRLKKQGPNELEQDPPPTFWQLFLDQFKDLLVIMLIVAAITSAALGEYEASITILFIVFFNAFIGVKMEMGAEAALEALQKQNPPLCEVRRDGQIKQIPSETLISGDIVMLATGKKIPADMRLLKSSDLQANEMALTGESEPVNKDANWRGDKIHDKKEEEKNEEEKVDEKESKEDKKEKKKEKLLTDRNMIYMGCAIQNGVGEAIVIHTGMKTRMGEIAHLLKTADEGDSPLKKKLGQLGVYLGVGSIVCSVVVFIIGLFYGKGEPGSTTPLWLQMLLVAVSLTVAAVPEGLPVCVTMSLAIGMKRMAEIHQVRIMKLRSVETLGSASVICTDKTGTLTKGEMTAVRCWYGGDKYQITGEGYDPKGFFAPLSLDVSDSKALEAAHETFKKDPSALPILVGLLNSNAELQWNDTTKKWECSGNSTERPLVVAAGKLGWLKSQIRNTYILTAENVFNSARKMASVMYEVGDSAPGKEWFQNPNFVVSVAGAPNYILNKCTSQNLPTEGKSGERSTQVTELSDAQKQDILKVIDEFSEQALRVLAFAYRTFESKPDDTTPDNLERDLTFCGLIASIDPARSEVAPSIQRANKAGVRVVMITGDYVKTAKAIAENIGILPRGSPPNTAVDCDVLRKHGDRLDAIEKELEEETTTKEQKKRLKDEQAVENSKVDDITRDANVFGRAKPKDKITIVRSFQRQGHVCAMTGDGVNDAPALKQANIGIAMGITGTDVAKAAADMILLNDSFVGIIAAIEQGRAIYANICKFVFYILSTNAAEVFLILIGVLMGLPPPLVPLQILWLNLTTDGAPAIALAMEATEPDTMNEGPRRQDEPLLDKIMLVGVGIQVTTLTAVTLGGYVFALGETTGAWNGHNDAITEDQAVHGRKMASTLTIILIVFAELFRAYSCRSMRESVFKIGIFSNRYMQYSVSVSVLATIFVAHCPGVMDLFEIEYLNGKLWGVLLGLSVVPFFVDELTKVVYRATGFGKRALINFDKEPGVEEKRQTAGYTEQVDMSSRNLQ